MSNYHIYDRRIVVEIYDISAATTEEKYSLKLYT